MKQDEPTIYKLRREVNEHLRTLRGISGKLLFAQKLRDRITVLEAQIHEIEKKRPSTIAVDKSYNRDLIQSTGVVA